MLITFLNHQWKAFWRSKNKGGSIAAQIFIGLILLYLLAVAVLVGLSLEILIEKSFPGKDVLVVFNGFILYYFAVEMIMRLQLQDLPTLSIIPYLHLKIPKQTIVNFLNVRALFSAFNILPLFIFIPFCVTAIADIYGSFTAIMYIVAIISLAIFNNYTALYVKRLSISNLKVVPIMLALIFTLGLLEYFKVFSIAAISNSVFSIISTHPLAALGFSLFALIMFLVNSKYLRMNLYTEELSRNDEKKTSTDYPILGRFGEIGNLAALELKLILRHKRTRSSIIMCVIFVFYGFLFYKKDFLKNDNFAAVLFAAVFMTGSLISIYGQFMFGWQAAHFDGLLVNKIDFRKFIKAKFLLFTIMSTFTTLIISLYGFISWKILAVQFAAYLYNIGIGTIIVLYFATRNYRAIDLTKAAAFNFQGVGASQWVLGLPYFLLPYVIFMPFYFAGLPYWGLIALGVLGAAALLTREFWVTFLLNQFNKRKYNIAEGFRE
ncbi:DUF5687 family protein [Pedobacter foliorum]|uniref:DUF5687 family protein n=1 Tax=Pedobacter foliorum TaxID=2739058 RepID=UPI0015669970|nr:DUF5687 family protein [Pedobacter foliorum]NRF38681.1 hypothetical protein [Pedobacter foliorum]